MFIGSEGVIFADTYCFRPVVYPENKEDDVRTAMWDAANMKVTNVAEANRFIKRPAYRKGWL